MTLSEFLLARIAEDEQPCVCLERSTGACGGGWCREDCRVCSGGGAFTENERMLAECEAKRAIVQDAAQMGLMRGMWALKRLAAVYSNHPNYRQEWKP